MLHGSSFRHLVGRGSKSGQPRHGGAGNQGRNKFVDRGRDARPIRRSWAEKIGGEGGAGGVWFYIFGGAYDEVRPPLCNAVKGGS